MEAGVGAEAVDGAGVAGGMEAGLGAEVADGGAIEDIIEIDGN